MKAKKAKLPYQKMAKAYKEMKKLGFSHDEVTQAATELMEVYDNNWEFIVDDSYKVLMDHMLAKNKEDGEGPSAEPLIMLHPRPELCENPSKKLRLEQDNEQVPIFADNSTQKLAMASTTGIEVVENLTSSSDTEEFEEPSLVRSHSKGFRQRDHETFIRADDQCNEDDLTEACSESELVKSNPLAIQIKTESRSWEGKSSEMCFMEEEEEVKSQKQELGKTVVQQLDPAGGSMDTPNVEPARDNLVVDFVPLAVMHPGLSAAFSGQSSGNCSDIKEDDLLIAERGDEQVPNKGQDSSGSSPFDIASSSNGAVKISLLCNSPHGSQVDTAKINAVFKMVEQKFVDSKIMDQSFSVQNLLKEICECYMKTNAGSASASDEQHLLTLKVLSTLDTSEESILPENNPDNNGLIVIPNNLTNVSLQNIPILNSLDGLQCISGFNFDEPLDIQALDLRDVGSLRAHVYCDDVTKGKENEMIALITRSSSAEDRPNFSYIQQSLIHDKAPVKTSIASISNRDCCLECYGNCLTSALPCVCAEKSGGFAYTSDGLLEEEFLEKCISTKPGSDIVNMFYCSVCPLGPKPCKGHLVRKFIKECWSKCGCSKKCGNRVVQRGITAKLQVFQAKEGKGWGLQAVDDLPNGAFVCEYVGEIFTDSELRHGNQKNAYSVLLDADLESMKDEEALWLDSRNYGNAARFINHRCSGANLIAIPVEIENPDHHYYHVAFFTTRYVDAMEELTWDYGIDFADDEPPFKCLCGSSMCRDLKRLM